MSLAIDVQRVIRVLLPDGWHEVLSDSFQVDSYEYIERDPDIERPHVVFRGDGGFHFIEQSGQRIDGPMTALLAVISRTGKL